MEIPGEKCRWTSERSVACTSLCSYSIQSFKFTIVLESKFGLAPKCLCDLIIHLSVSVRLVLVDAFFGLNSLLPPQNSIQICYIRALVPLRDFPLQSAPPSFLVSFLQQSLNKWSNAIQCNVNDISAWTWLHVYRISFFGYSNHTCRI